MSKQGGFEGKLNIGSDELDIARDVALSINNALIDVTARDSGGWRERIGGIKEFSLTVNVIYKDGVAAFAALRTALLAGSKVTGIEFIYKDTEGFTFDAFVESMDKGQPFEDADTVDITLNGTGVPVFSATGLS